MGTIFIASVFGPMALLAVLWICAAGIGVAVGEASAARDFIGSLMVWVLLGSGVVLIIEEATLAITATFGHRRIDWPKPVIAPDAKPEAAPDTRSRS